MPSLEASRRVNMQNYRPIKPTDPGQQPPQLTPVMPGDLSPSPVMISSLPTSATNVDGITRQFNGRGTVPVRRLIYPG